MKKLLLLLLCPLVFAQEAVSDEKLAMLRAVKVDAATSLEAKRDTSGSRAIVQLLLQPAKGSNIRVQLWLPAASKWNGRFLGLGNGGAAGGIA